MPFQGAHNLLENDKNWGLQLDTIQAQFIGGKQIEKFQSDFNAERRHFSNV